MASAVRDRYTLRDKAQVLLELAEGHSYRDASQLARIRAGQWTRGKNGERVFSRDGRLAGDWVAQYADIVAGPDLPDRWPTDALVLDHIEFRRLDEDEEGEPKKGGKIAFYVFGALGYADFTGKRPKDPKLWALAGYKWAGHEAWGDFLARLKGRPAYVVCDAHKGLAKALEERWPRVPVYPCVYHLYKNVYDDVRDYGLKDTELGKRLSKKMFYLEEPFDSLCYLLDNLMQAGRGRLTARQRKGVGRIDRRVERNQAGIRRRIEKPRGPLSTGALERHLRRIKQYLYDRRNVLRNMARLDDLLALMTVRQRNPVDVRAWARRLRQNHRHYQGAPPPRRVVDNPKLAPR